MNNLVSNFIGFEGRLNRQAWWIGVIVLIVVSIVLSWILGMILGTGNMALIGADGTIDVNAVAALAQKAAWQGLISSAILAYPYLAITIKRRHDRDNNGYDAMALIGGGLLYNLLMAIGIAPMGGAISTVIGLALAILAIWILVQAGFLKGTPGTNQYGADPLQG